MIEPKEVFIPIPKVYKSRVKVEVDGEDVTSKVYSSEWVIPCTTGIGSFKVRLVDVGGVYSSKFKQGSVVKFFADHKDGSTLQFWGRVDYPKQVLKKEGQFLELNGRHRSYKLTEVLVCHSAEGEDPSQILKDIIDKYAPGFTYNNVESSGLSMSVNWSYKPFWDCVVELCSFAGFDCFVDNDLDFHFFKENSRVNVEDAVSEKDNFRSLEEFGKDDYYERNRVIAVGVDDTGLPIVYTAESGSGEVVREVVVRDLNANTEEKVKALALAKLSRLTNTPPQGLVKSLGLESVKPGDNIWVVIPRQKIYGLYKVLRITHRFGSKVGGWFTECLIEREIRGTEQAVREALSKEPNLSKVENPNKLDFSYNFTFDDDGKTQSHSGTAILNGRLVMSSGDSSEGVWISKVKTVDKIVGKVELRVKGKDLNNSLFYFSLNNGVVWQEVGLDELGTVITPNHMGRNLVVKVVLRRGSGWEGLNPEVDSLALLYSFKS